jgi:hypothetical protein
MNSLTDEQIELLRRAVHFLPPPHRDFQGPGDRADVFLLLQLELIEVTDLGFRITRKGTLFLDLIDGRPH